MDFKKKIKELPDSPGVYLMKDSGGAIIYVGKAASLKKRVSSYFRRRPLSARLAALADNISDIDHINTATEAEALLLENTLIKSNQPKYNVALRDDKNYPLLKLTVNERFPRLFVTRIKSGDGAMYFGPYTSAKLLHQAVTTLRRVFLFRTCKTLPKSACLNYYLKQCLAPCRGKGGEARYREVVNQVIMFLNGNGPELIRELEGKMGSSAKEKKYEEAVGYRDQIRALTQFMTAPKGLDVTGQLATLKEVLTLKNLPRRIEAFDVSNISGREAVGSMVMFVDGKPYKNGYRKFKIREVGGIDDYKMIREIVRRRYQGLLEEKAQLPDLVLIDGGRGHLSSAKAELEKLNLADLPVISIAKEFEHIFVPNKPQPIKLPPNSPALYLIQRIRDEAHRFAIGYHKTLRGKLTSLSALDGIKGIGQKKKTALIKHFGSVEGIKRATRSDLLQINGITESLAKEILKKVR